MKIKDLSGQKFGRLTALYKLHNYHKKGTYWLCICECGNFAEVFASHLTSLHTKSCGCLHGEKHGDSHTRLHNTWEHMRGRCYNPNNPKYKNYGGRGIKICDEWYNSYLAFKDWAINNGYDDTLTIDRINNDGNYEPNNCRWATIKQQNNNQRKNLSFTINNVTKTLAQWCETYNISYHKAYQRIFKLGYNIEKAIKND